MNAAFSGITALLLWQLAAPAQEATIRGRVIDPDGRPLQDVIVIAEMVDSERKMTAGRPGRSNAEGVFEMTGIPAGKLILRAEPRVTIGNVNGQSVRTPRVQHPPAFFPGVLDRLDAWPIDVKQGEIIELDFHMPPMFIGSIKTVVSGPDGFTLDRVHVMRPEASQIKNVTMSEDGIGYVDSLREGRYCRRSAGANARLAACGLRARPHHWRRGDGVALARAHGQGPRPRRRRTWRACRRSPTPASSPRGPTARSISIRSPGTRARCAGRLVHRRRPVRQAHVPRGRLTGRLAGDRDSPRPQRHYVQRHRSRPGFGERDLDRRGATATGDAVSGTATLEPRDIVDSRTRHRRRDRQADRRRRTPAGRLREHRGDSHQQSLDAVFAAGEQDLDWQRRQLRLRRHQGRRRTGSSRRTECTCSNAPRRLLCRAPSAT